MHSKSRSLVRLNVFAHLTNTAYLYGRKKLSTRVFCLFVLLNTSSFKTGEYEVNDLKLFAIVRKKLRPFQKLEEFSSHRWRGKQFGETMFPTMVSPGSHCATEGTHKPPGGPRDNTITDGGHDLSIAQLWRTTRHNVLFISFTDLSSAWLRRNANRTSETFRFSSHNPWFQLGNGWFSGSS